MFTRLAIGKGRGREVICVEHLLPVITHPASGFVWDSFEELLDSSGNATLLYDISVVFMA